MTIPGVVCEAGLVIKLNVADLALSTEWYQTKLGLVHDPRFDLPHFAQFNIPNVRRVAVGLFEAPTAVGTGGCVPIFVVRDVVSDRNNLITLGVDVSPIESAGDGVQLAFFKDPDGNALAIRQNPDSHPSADQVGDHTSQ
jgi:glyoxylase I family protein